MIDVKQAVQIAKQSAAEILGKASNLEEIERESYKDRETWSITLSVSPDPQIGSASTIGTALAQLAGPQLKYKRFLIDIETGELLAIKLRELASR